MNLPNRSRNIVSGFLKAIEPWESGYSQHSFAYIARKTNKGAFAIAQGIIWLNSAESRVPFRHFETENICAEHFKLSDIGRSYAQCIQDLCNGMIVTPRGKRFFPPAPGGYHGAYFTPLHPSALQSQSRVNVLQLKGEKQHLSSGPSLIDWELRGANTPYDTIQELLNDYNLGGLFTDRTSVEVVASAIMGFDGDCSTIDGEIATIVIRLAKTLDLSQAAVGFREITPGKTNRGKLVGSQFTWRQTETMQIGSFELPVTRAAILHCYAMYKNVAQTHWFITDPRTSQNPRRVVFESFDTGIAILKEFLGRTRGKGQDARDLETAAAWLFWMVGFNTVQLGSTGKTQDFADVILMTPNGHIAIVECTTGLLRADNKLPKLVARYALVRSKLDQSNNAHLKLLPIMVSTLSKDELHADLEQAAKLGVGVLTREDLDQLVERTVISSNADELFTLAEKSIEAARHSSTASEPELPLDR